MEILRIEKNIVVFSKYPDNREVIIYCNITYICRERQRERICIHVKRERDIARGSGELEERMKVGQLFQVVKLEQAC